MASACSFLCVALALMSEIFPLASILNITKIFCVVPGLNPISVAILELNFSDTNFEILAEKQALSSLLFPEQPGYIGTFSITTKGTSSTTVSSSSTVSNSLSIFVTSTASN